MLATSRRLSPAVPRRPECWLGIPKPVVIGIGPVVAWRFSSPVCYAPTPKPKAARQRLKTGWRSPLFHAANASSKVYVSIPAALLQVREAVRQAGHAAPSLPAGRVGGAPRTPMPSNSKGGGRRSRNCYCSPLSSFRPFCPSVRPPMLVQHNGWWSVVRSYGIRRQ